MELSTFIWSLLLTLPLVAIAAIFLSLFKNRTKKNTFLILGLSDSGKTSLFLKLRYGKLAQTHTSMKENEGYITIGNDGEKLTKESVHIVDVPGHEKLRFKFSDFVPITRGIIFLIDSSNCVKNVRSIAEYIYDILSNKEVIRQRIHALIACNKSDMITALPPDRIKTMLENEINRLRLTRTAALDHQDSSEDVEFLGYESEDFRFEHLENEIQFEKCSIEKGEILEIGNWIVESLQSGK